MRSDPDQIVRELHAARKYRSVCEDTVGRVARWAAERYPDQKDAIKAAKRKLHQVFAAFLESGKLDRLQAHVQQLPSPSDASFREACLALLGEHASTAERIPLLDELYPRLWAEVGRPRVLLDLACGYHPFAWPWFGLDAETVYRPSDIDLRLVAAVNLFLGHVGLPPTAEPRDVLAGVPDARADVAFLFKTLATLDQQDRGAGAAILRAIPARFVVVSFPLRSLGGHAKGMRETYDQRMTEILDELKFRSKRLEFPGEVFYLLETADPIPPASG
jgi:16S rRNA (guanine(1405)-N(7))-methyltransferase